MEELEDEQLHLLLERNRTTQQTQTQRALEPWESQLTARALLLNSPRFVFGLCCSCAAHEIAQVGREHRRTLRLGRLAERGTEERRCAGCLGVLKRKRQRRRRTRTRQTNLTKAPDRVTVALLVMMYNSLSV